MKRTTKRITALIIAAIMLISMIPFAAAEEAAAPDYEFKFTRGSHGYSSNTSLWNNTEGKSNFTVEGTAEGYDKWGYINAYKPNNRSVRSSCTWYNYKKTQGYNYAPFDGVLPVFLALEIVIDKPGAYTPSFSWEARPNSPYFDIYLIKAPTDEAEAAAWKDTNSNSCLYQLIGVDPLGTVNPHTDGDSSPKELSPIKIADGDEGSYYLIFVPNGASAAAETGFTDNTDLCEIRLASFSLTKIEDDSDIPEIPEKFEISLSDEVASDTATFNFIVPKTGAYDLFFKYAKNASGGTGYAYIDGKYVGEVNFYKSAQADTNYINLRSVSLEEGTTHTLTLVAAENGAGGSADMYPKGMVFRAAETLAQPTKLLLSFPKTDLILGDAVWADVKYEFDNGVTIPAHEKSLETLDKASAYTLETEGTAVTVEAGGKLSSAVAGTARVRAVTDELTSDWVSVTVIKKQIGSAEITTPKEWILLSNSEGMKLDVTAKYNTGDDVDVENAASIAFRSSDEKIATVTADGTIVPVGAGEAVIYADVTVEDVTVTAEKKILITKDPIYPDVFVNFNYDGVVNDAAVTATLEKQGWEINKEKTDAALLADGIIRHKTNYGLQIQGSTAEKDNTLAIDFVVPETCAYDLVMKHCIVGNGGTGYMYIDGIYAGEVNFHNKTQVNDNFTPLRSFYLEEGKTHTLTLVSMKNGGNGNARMYPGGLKLTGTGELAGISAVTFETERSSIAAGETEPYEVYARQENGVEFFPRPSLDGVTETGLTVESSNPEVASLVDGYIKGISSGTTSINISGRLNGTDVNEAFEFTVNENTYKEAKIDVATDKFFIGGKTELSASAYLSDGSRINDRDISVSFTSDNTYVATVEEGKMLSLLEEGEANITAQITFNGQTYPAERKIKVVPISIERIEASIKESIISSFSETGAKISVKAFNNDGTDASLEGAVYSYESMTPDIVGVTEDGEIYYVSRGAGVVRVTANIGGIDLTYDLEVVSSSGKTEPTVFTYEMRENARDNISKYSWAKSMQKTAVSNAENDITNLDKIYDLIMYEGIPRSFTPALLNDPNAYSCVYCGIDIRNKYSQYGWVMDPLNRPWQIQCPDCKRLFPSNDFESFYELGLDQKGQFDRIRALEAHRELFVDKENSPASPGTTEWSADWCAYYGYGKGYLKNELYKEVGETLSVAADKVATWAVDDGYGWETGTTTSSGYPIKKTFVAVYNHFLYSNMNSSNVIIQALENLREAYVFTGDIKYGRAGAILIDRLADVYPSYDLAPYAMYQNSHGGGNAGKILGNIWENSVAKALINAYDAFWPAMEDPQVIEYLSEKAEQFGLENPKTSADMIRENCETGILREVFKGAKAAQMKGNFGMVQETTALAGIALDTYPESAEMFEWIENEQIFTTTKGCPVVGYPNRTATVYTASTGGDIFNTIINKVDRDGFGNEGSPQYNLLWVTRTLNMAEAFHRYGKYDGLNLYENVKYKKMLTSILDMTVGSGYTLQIGDDGRTGSLDNETSETAALRGFERIGDPAFAQVVYLLNDGDLEGTYIDIYEKNAEDIQDRIKAAVEEHGELSLGSRNLTGYGLAILAGGQAVESSNTQENSNFSRDTWLWYGDTTASHGHYDKLQMGINAYGFNFTPDLGYPAATGTDANRLQWVANTLSHNTVTVNEEAQLAGYMADALHYDADGIVKVVDAEDSSVYTATDIYRRTLVTVEASTKDAYTVDFFRVRGGKEHVYSFHTQSADGVTVDGLELIPDPVVKDADGNDIVGSYAGPDVAYGKDPDTKDAWSYDTRYPRGYTWLRNVRRDESPASGSFSVNFKQTDFRKSVPNSKGLNLKFTALNDWTPSSVGFAVGEPPRIKANNMIPYLDYMFIHNKGGNGLDTLFTSVIQPYNGEEYIESMTSIPLTNAGGETKDDTAKAVRVKLKSGRCDYIIYATNSDVLYTLTDGDVSFDFSGFIGVYSVNESGKNVYSYVNDGGQIGDLYATARYTGSVVSFTEELTENNFITVKMDSALTDEEIGALPGRYIYIDNDTTENGAYRIETAEKSGESIVLGIGFTTLINGYKDTSDMSLGYVYNIEPKQTFSIPLSAEANLSPEMEEQEDVTTSAGSSVSVTVRAESPDGEKLTYIGTVLPRGASVNAETGVVTWKPDSSQIGEAGFLITARDESGRESSISFTVTVYGSTTGNKTEPGKTPDTPAGGGGGGGGGAAPTPDTPDDTKTDDNQADNGGESGETEGNTDNTGTEDGALRFTDLGSHAWAEDAINTLADDGIIKGTSASTFTPSANITRADFASLLVRAFDLTSDNTENFADVSASDYFASELAIARNTGIVNGIGDNKFAPRNTITRQDMMVIVYRALTVLAKLPSPRGEGGPLAVDEVEINYPDYSTVADYASDAVSALIGAGLVNGKSGRIAPLDYTTRAEIAVLLKRVIDYVK